MRVKVELEIEMPSIEDTDGKYLEEFMRYVFIDDELMSENNPINIHSAYNPIPDTLKYKILED